MLLVVNIWKQLYQSVENMIKKARFKRTLVENNEKSSNFKVRDKKIFLAQVLLWLSI